MESINDLWKILLTDLSAQLSALVISTWFDEVVPVKLTDTDFSLYCPNEFKRSVIQKCYLQPLQDALYARFSTEIRIAFVSTVNSAAVGSPQAEQDFLRGRGKLTFDSFVVGDSNRIAYTAAQRIAAGFGEYCSPLVIYGAPGLGKTHLLHAIFAYVRQNTPQAQVVMVKSDDFTNELVDAIQHSCNSRFRQKYRNASVFLMDDAQFIAGKKQTQEEFYNTFETLHQNGCSIVLTLDRPPSEVAHLEKRISSRFEGGLLAEIKEPEYETRLEIVHRKGQERGLSLLPEEAAYIAGKVTGSVRKIEGLLNKLKVQGGTAALETAVADLLDPGRAPATPEQVIARAARAFHADPQEIRGKSKKRSIVLARQAVMYILCRRHGMTTMQVGRLLGRDHSTVLHSLQVVEEKLLTDRAFAVTMATLTASLPLIRN